MGAPFATKLLGWKKARWEDGVWKNARGWPFVPNCADVANNESLDLGAAMLSALNFENPNVTYPEPFTVIAPASPGVQLENKVRDHLKQELPKLDPDRQWFVQRGKGIQNFAQYQHLVGLDKAIEENPNLRVTLGTDYLIEPDVTVGLNGTPTFTAHPWLHAAVACKWTIRSDRVQNIRHENRNMINHRRGRLPHLVTVTAEPLPTRLASIARGTGEVDVTYHIALDELRAAVDASTNANQKAHFSEVTEQGRLRDFNLIAEDFATW